MKKRIFEKNVVKSRFMDSHKFFSNICVDKFKIPAIIRM